MTRIEVDDFGTWLAVHLGDAGNRRSHGMVDGPICREIDHPNAVLIHTHIEDMDSAMQWLTVAYAAPRAVPSYRSGRGEEPLVELAGGWAG